MRNMSFALTTAQVLARTKTVTRRLGWANLKPGQRFRAVKKCMGLKKGEKIEVLAELECVSNRAEQLYDTPDSDCAKEGFPEMDSEQFCQMFSSHMKCDYSTAVNRIEFKYVD